MAERFEAAAREGPVERPRVLPRWARKLALAITGGRQAPSVSAGPNTRSALEAAGARAAASGSTILLPRAPREVATASEAGVLAHEMVHASPRPPAAPRTRFFGDDRGDHEERAARGIGDVVRRMVAGPTIPPAPLARAPAPLRVAGMAASEPSRRRTGEALAARAGSAMPGVSGLPVAGPGGFLVPAAQPAGAGGEALSGPAGQPDPTAPAAPRGIALDELVAMAGRAMAAPRVAPAEEGRGAAEGAAGPGAPAAPPVQGAGGAASGLVGSAASAATDPFSQMGELMEALEERLLAELERRGGRFAGVF